MCAIISLFEIFCWCIVQARAGPIQNIYMGAGRKFIGDGFVYVGWRNAVKNRTIGTKLIMGTEPKLIMGTEPKLKTVSRRPFCPKTVSSVGPMKRQNDQMANVNNS